MHVTRVLFPPEIKQILQNEKVCYCADMPHGAGHVRTCSSWIGYILVGR